MHKKMKKKGMELSIEAIVIVALALFFLVLMLQFIRTTFNKGYNFLDYIDEQIKTQVMDRCKMENKKIFLYKNTYDKSEITFAAIKNLGIDDAFTMDIADASGKGINIDEWFDYRADGIGIKAGECSLIGINIHIPDGADKDSYIFDLRASNSQGLYSAEEFVIDVK